MANEDKMIEMAEAIAQDIVDNGIHKASKMFASPPPQGYDGTCPECGEPVPEARQKLNRYNCVDCQELSERAAKQSRQLLN